MTIETIYTPPIEWIAAALQAIPAAPGRRAVVLVAAERVAHAIRRHVCIARQRPQDLAGVRLLRPADFAREMLLRAGRVRRAGWEDVRRLRILRVFDSGAIAGALRYFDATQLRSGHGYADAFARTIADLESSGLDADEAGDIADDLRAADTLAGNRLHDVAVIWRAADTDRGASATTAQLFHESAALLTAQPESVASWGPSFALLTGAPTTALLRLLRAIPDCHCVLQEARPWRDETQRWRNGLALPAAVSTADVDTELRLVQRYVFALPETLTDPERPRSHGPDGSVDLEEYASLEDEIEGAAAWLAEQIAAGTPLEDTALLVPEAAPYALRLIDRLRRLPGGVTAYVAGGLSLWESPAGMRLHALLRALAHGLEAEVTIRLLPALRRGAQDGASAARLSPSRAAAIVYGAGIAGGGPGDGVGWREWVPCLTHRRDVLRQLVATAEDDQADEPEKRRHVLDRQHAAHWLRDVEPILPGVQALQDVAGAIVAGVSLPVAWQQIRAFAESWLRMPPDPPSLLAVCHQHLQPMLSDPIAQHVAGVDAVQCIVDVLAHVPWAVGRFGEPAVFIGTPAQAAGLPFRTVRILGLTEGGLPRTPHDDPIVPDTLRVRLEAAAGRRHTDVVVPLLRDRVLDDIHDVFRAMYGARERLALSAPRQWIDRSEREVSGIMLEVATALGRDAQHPTRDGDVPTAGRLRAAYLNPGRAARLRHAAAVPVSPRMLMRAGAESGLPPLAAGRRVPADWMASAALAIDRIQQLGAALDGGELGSMDGIVAEVWGSEQAPGLTPQRPISASALGMLLTCPHRFLLQRILHLDEPAPRPSTASINPIDYGSLFHAAAEELFRAAGPALCRGEGELPLWEACARDVAARHFERLCRVYPLRGSDSIARERRRLEDQLCHLVQYEWQRPRAEFLASELRFGDPEPVRLPLADGMLFVWGAIDRVDRLGPGALSVRDLKTGRVRDFGEEGPNAGRDLQIGLYSVALEASGYGGSAARVAEAVYVHPSAAQEPERAFAGTELDLLRRRVQHWLGVAHLLLSHGRFPRTPNPDDCRSCPFVPACGDGAQPRSAAKLARLATVDVVAPFVRFKQERRDEEV